MPVADVITLADAATACLAERASEPLVIFGHSLGGSIAYETAARLEQLGQAARLLVVSGTPAPSSGEVTTPMSEAEVLDAVRRNGRTPAEVLASADLMELVTPVLVADFNAARSYRAAASSPLRTPALVLSGSEDAKVNATTSQWAIRFRDVTFETISGGHFFMDDDPLGVLRAVEGRLAQLALS